MGISCGPAPDRRIIDLLAEYGHGEWRVDYATWVAMLSEMYRSSPALERELTLPALATFYGMPIRMDDTMPDGTIELQNSKGETLGRIENVDAQHGPRRVRKPMTGDEWVESEYNKRLAATGPTTRLERRCAACGDELPVGAVFCIVCGKEQ